MYGGYMAVVSPTTSNLSAQFHVSVDFHRRSHCLIASSCLRLPAAPALCLHRGPLSAQRFRNPPPPPYRHDEQATVSHVL